MADEKWATHPRFPSYRISDAGRVMSCVHKKARILKGGLRGKYIGLTLVDAAGTLRSVYLHRLVAEVFLGPCPSGGECCHNDNDRTNNGVANLRWDTRSGNFKDKIANGTMPWGERHGRAKLTWKQVVEMRAERERSRRAYRAIARDFGVSDMTAYRAITGQSWK